MSFFQGLNAATEVIRAIFLIFPQYCLGGGLVDLAKNQITSEIYMVASLPALLFFNLINFLLPCRLLAKVECTKVLSLLRLSVGII